MFVSVFLTNLSLRAKSTKSVNFSPFIERVLAGVDVLDIIFPKIVLSREILLQSLQMADLWHTYILIYAVQFMEKWMEMAIWRMDNLLKCRPCPFIQILSYFYPDLSRFYPNCWKNLDKIRIKFEQRFFFKLYPDFILILSRFLGNSHYPNFIWIKLG